MSGRRLLLPVEVKARELRAKVLLAVHAAAAGWRVYVGKSGAVQTLAKYVPPSVYIDKNILPARADFFDRVKARGHVLLAGPMTARAVPVLRLDLACVEAGDYSALSPIEPSAQGGQKIVDLIVAALG